MTPCPTHDTPLHRPGNIDANKLDRAMLELLVDQRLSTLPAVKITIRADRRSCRGRLLRCCDRHGIGFVQGLTKNPVLKRAAQDEITRVNRSGSWARSRTRRGPAARFGLIDRSAQIACSMLRCCRTDARTGPSLRRPFGHPTWVDNGYLGIA